MKTSATQPGFRIPPAAKRLLSLLPLTLTITTALLLWAPVSPATATTADQLRTISVSANATITAKAEHAVIHAQLKMVSDSMAESYAALTKTLTDIGNALEPLGISKDELIISVISQGPEYNWNNNIRTITGYASSCSIQIRNTEIEATYGIHETLASFKDLSISHTEYGRDDESLLLTAALQQALQSAEVKARAMVETLAAQLGPVQRIRETSQPIMPAPRLEASMRTGGDDPATVTTTGSISVTGSVEVEFAIQ